MVWGLVASGTKYKWVLSLAAPHNAPQNWKCIGSAAKLVTSAVRGAAAWSLC